MTLDPPLSEIRWRMPAEWEPHEATWIAWPHHQDDWPGKFAAIPWVYAEIVRHLHQSEEVRILVNGATARAKPLEPSCGTCRSTETRRLSGMFPTDRVWTRDYGPDLRPCDRGPSGSMAVLDWQFNAWAKYPNLAARQRRRRHSSAATADAGPAPPWATRVVLEGGSIDVNGQGCC